MIPMIMDYFLNHVPILFQKDEIWGWTKRGSAYWTYGDDMINVGENYKVLVEGMKDEVISVGV